MLSWNDIDNAIDSRPVLWFKWALGFLPFFSPPDPFFWQMRSFINANYGENFTQPQLNNLILQLTKSPPIFEAQKKLLLSKLSLNQIHAIMSSFLQKSSDASSFSQDDLSIIRICINELNNRSKKKEEYQDLVKVKKEMTAQLSKKNLKTLMRELIVGFSDAEIMTSMIAKFPKPLRTLLTNKELREKTILTSTEEDRFYQVQTDFNFAQATLSDEKSGEIFRNSALAILSPNREWIESLRKASIEDKILILKDLLKEDDIRSIQHFFNYLSFDEYIPLINQIIQNLEHSSNPALRRLMVKVLRGQIKLADEKQNEVQLTHAHYLLSHYYTEEYKICLMQDLPLEGPKQNTIYVKYKDMEQLEYKMGDNTTKIILRDELDRKMGMSRAVDIFEDLKKNDIKILRFQNALLDILEERKEIKKEESILINDENIIGLGKEFKKENLIFEFPIHTQLYILDRVIFLIKNHITDMLYPIKQQGHEIYEIWLKFNGNNQGGNILLLEQMFDQLSLNENLKEVYTPVRKWLICLKDLFSLKGGPALSSLEEVIFSPDRMNTPR